jgi:hypothetical protein
MKNLLFERALQIGIFALIWWIFWYISARISMKCNDIGGPFWYEGRHALPVAAVLFTLLVSWRPLRNRITATWRVLLATAVCLILSPLWLILVIVCAEAFGLIG